MSENLWPHDFGEIAMRTPVAILREQARLDSNFLAALLKRHQLEEKWKLWTE